MPGAQTSYLPASPSWASWLSSHTCCLIFARWLPPVQPPSGVPGRRRAGACYTPLFCQESKSRLLLKSLARTVSAATSGYKGDWENVWLFQALEVGGGSGEGSRPGRRCGPPARVCRSLGALPSAPLPVSCHDQARPPPPLAWWAAPSPVSTIHFPHDNQRAVSKMLL